MFDPDVLRRIHETGQAAQRAEAVAIAQGLAYNPHVDGRLRLTEPGRQMLEGSATLSLLGDDAASS